MRVFIHSGHLSLDNGAVAPFTVFKDLASLLGVPAEYGQHYYDDSLEVPDEQWPTVLAMLEDARMLYRVEGVHDQWQNVQNARLRELMKLPALSGSEITA